jgi:hypothetical protein
MGDLYSNQREWSGSPGIREGDWYVTQEGDVIMSDGSDGQEKTIWEKMIRRTWCGSMLMEVNLLIY